MKKLIILILTLIVNVSVLFAAPKAVPLFPTPAELNDNSVKVKFEVDSTWHLIKGTTSGLTGKIERQVETPGDIAVTLSLPVVKFNTEKEARDERMREVMAEPEFPQVTVTARGSIAECDQRYAEVASCRDDSAECAGRLLPGTIFCSGTLYGEISIRGVSKPIVLDFKVEPTEGGFKIAGQQLLKWSDHNVEDPSIFIAKLKREVLISYELSVTR